MSKGSRRERELHQLYQNAGWAPYRPATVRYGENDVWGLFDVLAVTPTRDTVHGVQVKSNTAAGVRAWTRHTRLWRALGFRTLYAVPVDSRGWRIIDCTDDGRETVVDERDTPANMGERVTEWLR
jgi:Holliday junction resolvase